MSTRDWYGLDPILKTIGLDQLVAEGVTNLSRSARNHDSPSSAFPATPGEEFRKAFPQGAGVIHPIYRKDNWMISQANYEVLLPAIRLASMLLEDPAILPFFRGLLDLPLKRLGDDKAEKLYNQKLYVFDWLSGNEDPWADQVDGWKAIANLSTRIRFEIVDMPGSAFMQTRPVQSGHPKYVNQLPFRLSYPLTLKFERQHNI